MPISLAENEYHNSNHLWGIVLAGGEGKRLEHFVRSRCAAVLPKQYCVFHGTRSMLSNTISRVELLIPANHIIVSIQHEHKNYAAESISGIPHRNIAVQPMNRETGIGIIHALMRIYHADPYAVVAIFPSDHFILEEERFMECVENGVAFVRNHKEQLLILGVEPEQPESDYGWIKPGAVASTVNGSVVYTVKSFLEKPSRKQAIELYENKYLWNTSVIISSAHTLISRFYRLMPEIVFSMLSLRDHLNSPTEYEKTKAVYEQLPPVNFSYSILQSAVHELSVLRLQNVYWSDWGNPERIEKDIALHHQHSKENNYKP